MPPLISVILPVYNGERFVISALRSILQQSVSDIEVIVINDGSTDSTEGLLSQIRDERLRLVSRPNRGLIDSLNEGVSLATGKYIARMDADDIAHPKRFELQLEFMRRHDLHLCGSAIRTFGASSKIKRYPSDDKTLKYGMLFLGKSFPHPTVIGLREVFEKFPYDKEFVHAEDAALWLKIISLDGIRVGNHPKPLLKYRLHQEQVSAVHSLSQTAMETKLISMALGMLEVPYNDSLLKTHVGLRRKIPAVSVVDILNYGEWLVQLQQILETRWGSSRVIAEKWYELCALSQSVHPEAYDLFYANKLSNGVPLRKRFELMVKKYTN